MFQPTRALSLALAAALLLPGCSGFNPAGNGRSTLVTTVAKAGAVKVSFPGLAPRAGVFRTLATRQDIDRVEVTLVSSNGKQTRSVSRDELWAPMVNLEFKRVPAGPIQFLVLAFDDAGVTIGKANQVDEVRANQTTVVGLTVKLAPGDASGGVAATIDFVDGDAPAPCGEDAFHAADRDGNGRLDLSEYAGGFPYRMACDEPAVNVVAVSSPPSGSLPVGCTMKPVAPIALKCAPAPMPPDFLMPPHRDPALEAFEALDLDGNQELTLEEFLGISTPPMDPCEGEFRSLDGDGDGVLTFKEWIGGRPVPMPAIGRPGEVALDLVPRNWKLTFRLRDRDGNGVLDLSEHCADTVSVPVMPVQASR